MRVVQEDAVDGVGEGFAREVQPGELLDDCEWQGEGGCGFERRVAEEACEAPGGAGFEGGFEEDVDEGEGQGSGEEAGVARRQGLVGCFAVLERDGEAGEEGVEGEEEEGGEEEDA